MTVREFRNVVCRSLIVELESYRTQESIKKCRFTELTEEDLALKIDSVWPVLERSNDHKIWDTAFKIVVYQD